MGQQQSNNGGTGAPVGTMSTQDGVAFILADWCGHCKHLKQSGEIEKLMAFVPVTIYRDMKHIINL